ncbi:hypothetical protein NX059_001195 [Plenodomus lindquistii]|nr:hypothetical protein NX059_001195 [Plenodomus lindquistii]
MLGWLFTTPRRRTFLTSDLLVLPASDLLHALSPGNMGVIAGSADPAPTGEDELFKAEVLCEKELGFTHFPANDGLFDR